MKEIKLTRGKVTLVDDEDYATLKRYKWYAMTKRGRDYASRNISLTDGRKRPEYLHRVVMRAPSGLCVDHVNHDTLDNRKENLRLCTNRENTINREKGDGTSSQFKGVSYDLSREQWASYIKVLGKKRYLGRYNKEQDAALAYNQAAEIYFGEFALLNEIV